MNILVTGAAGFIGYHLAIRLINEGHYVIGIDNINNYYSTKLKYGRLAESGIDTDTLKNAGYGKQIKSSTYPQYSFVQMDVSDLEAVHSIFSEKGKFDIVCHLAAQAGVRYSLENPHAYIDSNINGFINILEACRHNNVKHLVYASSSSVYGLNESMPFSTSDNVDHPVSLYAATKKSNELMAHTYSYLYNIPTTGLRFFTVYGPWGRPDMAYYLFTKAILQGNTIDVYNYGNMKRDFTYIDDIIEGMVKVIESPPGGNKKWSGKNPDPATSPAPYKVYNIGNGKPVDLMEFIGIIEESLGKTAEKNFLPIQPGDVPTTWADTADLEKDIEYKPYTPVKEGVKRFVEWYREYYN